jgi:hypothetical protein
MAVGLEKYKHNFITVKRYGDSYVRVVLHKVMRERGLEDDSASPVDRSPCANDEKLAANISRAKGEIEELVACNPWEYFITLTLDPQKYDRHDLNKFRSDFARFIRHYNEGRNPEKQVLKVQYLLIPEQHKDGAWHMHGFIMGLPLHHFRAFTLGEKLPNYIRSKLLRGQSVYEWEPYRAKFGFCDFEPVRDLPKCANYVKKYITKDLSRCVSALGAHLYYGSQHLRRAELLAHGYWQSDCIDLDARFSGAYENDYVKIVRLDIARLSPEARERILSGWVPNVISEVELSDGKRDARPMVAANPEPLIRRGENIPANCRKESFFHGISRCGAFSLPKRRENRGSTGYIWRGAHLGNRIRNPAFGSMKR